MRKVVSLLLASSLLTLAGCAGPDSSQQAPATVTTPVISDSAPAPAAAAPAATPGPAKTGPLPPLTIKPDARELHPAYTFAGGAQKWGYVDASGTFVIQPVFDRAAAFESDGLAIVQQGGKSGLTNKDGKQVVAPEWSYIRPANGDGVRVLQKSGAGQTVDTSGKVLFRSPVVTDNFSSGLAPYCNETHLCGYVNRVGEVVIPAQFQSAGAFKEGKATVKVGDGAWAVLDTTGKRLGEFGAYWVTDLAENMVAFEEKSSSKWGFASVTGQVVVPAKFGDVEPFQDGFAVVNSSDSYAHPQKGLINTRGEFVIPATYGALEPLGGGLYAAAKPTEIPTPSQFMPMAILTQDGKQLTDFQYYNMQPVSQGLISVSDGQDTFFLDTQGQRVQSMPTLGGFGTLAPTGSLIKADVDGRLTLLDRSSKIIWQSDNTIALAGRLRVHEKAIRPNLSTLILYPEFTGMADPKVQEALNRTLRLGFVGPESAEPSQGDKVQPATVDVNFTIRQLQNLVILNQTGYWFGWGAAHGMPSRVYYHIDSQTGSFYTLSDLFKKESNFTDRLRTIVAKQIAAEANKPFEENPEVKPSQPFYVSADALTIYYRPYEIGPYAMGFIEFPIPWSEISDLIDTNGPFWKSFH